MQDYVMRLIQQMAQMLAAIMGFRRAGRNAEARSELERLCLQTTAGLPLALVKQASPEALRAYLESGGPRRLARDILLAELLLQDAEMIAHDDALEEAVRSNVHAFCLIFDAMDSLTREDAAHYKAKLDEVASRISGHTLDLYAAEKLRRWMERREAEESLTGSALPA